MSVGRHILGLQLDGYQTCELTQQKLNSVNYLTYPDQYSHMLVHAIQFNKKIPSISRMEKTEKKNKGEVQTQKSKNPKKIPQGRKVMPQFQRSRSSSVKKARTQSKPYQIYSPQQIALKSQRIQFIQNIKRWKGHSMIPEVSKPQAPLYFKKKRASHRRRIKERKQLIKMNRSKLIQIFGAEILKKKLTIGRQEIRTALGIQMKVVEPEAIGEFMKMAEHNSK